MRKIYLSLLLICSISIVQAQNVNIPDSNFKAYLLENSEINSNGDDEISEEEAASYTGGMQLPISSGIEDLTGLEAFVNLESFDTYYFNETISHIDVTQNTKLKVLECGSNQVEEIDLSNNVELEILNLSDTKISNLDLSNNPKIEILRLANMINLESIDLSVLPELKELYLYTLDDIGKIKKIDASNNPKLEVLRCNNMPALEIVNVASGQNNGDVLYSFHAYECPNLSTIVYDKDFDIEAHNNLPPRDDNHSPDHFKWLIFDNASDFAFVQESVAPVILVNDPIELVLDKDSNTATLTVSDVDNGSYDDYTEAQYLTFELSKTSFTKDDLGSNQVIFSVTDKAGNTNSKEITVNIVENNLGLEDTSLNNKVNIYPNPVRDVLYVELPQGNNVRNIELYNIVGQKVLNTKQTTINTSNLNKGVYMIKVEDIKGNVTTQKIVKQ